MKKYLLVCVVVMIITSCSPIAVLLYDGPEQPNSQVAKFSISSVSNDNVRFDGRSIPMVGSKMDLMLVGNIYHILPGPHTIEIESDSRSLHPINKNLILSFDAQAGRKYSLYLNDICIPSVENGNKAYYFPEKMYLVQELDTMTPSKTNMDKEYIVPRNEDYTINIFSDMPITKCVLLKKKWTKYILNGTTDEGTKIRFNMLESIFFPSSMSGFISTGTESLFTLPGQYIIGIVPAYIPGASDIKAEPVFMPIKLQTGHEYEIGFDYNHSFIQSNTSFFYWFPFIKDLSTGAFFVPSAKIDSFSFSIDRNQNIKISDTLKNDYGYLINYDQNGNLKTGAPYIIEQNPDPEGTKPRSFSKNHDRARFDAGQKILCDSSLFPETVKQAVNDILGNQDSRVIAYLKVESPKPEISKVKSRYGNPETKDISNRLSIIPENMIIYYYGGIGFAVKSNDNKGQIHWIVIE